MERESFDASCRGFRPVVELAVTGLWQRAGNFPAESYEKLRCEIHFSDDLSVA